MPAISEHICVVLITAYIKILKPDNIAAKKPVSKNELVLHLALEVAGIETVVASSKLGTCTGKLGGQAEATVRCQGGENNYQLRPLCCDRVRGNYCCGSGGGLTGA